MGMRDRVESLRFPIGALWKGWGSRGLFQTRHTQDNEVEVLSNDR